MIAPDIASGVHGDFAQRSLQRSRRAESLRQTSDISDQQKADLQTLVTAALNEKLQQQERQVQQLKQKLAQVEQALKERQQNRERVIDRRVEELLDPNVDWSTIMPKGTISESSFGIRSR